MSWNTSLFLFLNAATRPDTWSLYLLEGLADLPVFLTPVLLAALWVVGASGRRPALIAAGAAVFVGQGTNWLLGLVWFEPRPFMAGIGYTWMAHIPDNGFPSDHATLAWSLGLALVLTEASVRWGLVACLSGAAAGWARVRLGVHFPVDVLAAVPVGMLAAMVARGMLPPIRVWVTPLAEQAYEVVLERLPALRQRNPDNLPRA